MKTKILKRIVDNKYVIFIILFCLLIVVAISILSTGDKTDPISNIADNLHLNVWDWLALIVAFLSLVVSVMTWHSQNETRKNTAIVSSEELQDKLSGYYHSLIRNVINLYSLHIKMDLNNWESYPSEDYMWKMKLTEIDENNISIRLVYGDRFHKIQNFNELIRFFNYSIDATIAHLKQDTLNKGVRKRDIYNLKSMVWLISEHLSNTMNSLFPEDKSHNQNKIRNILTESIGRWYTGIASNQNKLDDNGSYFQDIDSQRFLNDIFNENIDLKNKFLANLKSVIHHHLSKRSDGYDRIPLIDF